MAITALIRSIRGRLRVAVALAMVPMAVLSGRPVTGCICADGHYELFCRADLCPGRAGGADQSPRKAACCGCSCCASDRSVGSGHSCCKGKTDCFGRTSRRSHGGNGQGAHGQGVQDKGCCTPVLVAQAMPTVVASSRAVDEQHTTAQYLATVDVPFSVSEPRIGQRVEWDTGPPPVDLVVTLLRLVI